MGYFDNPLTGGIDTFFGGGSPTGESEMGRAVDIYRNMNRFGHEVSRPGVGIMDTYAQPAFSRAYNAARNLDRLPEMTSVYEAIRERMAGQQARYGMAGSGAAFNQGRALGRDFAVTRQNEALRARALQQAAYAALANQAMGAGLNAAALRMQGQQAYGGARMGRAQQQANQNMMEQQATGQLLGGAANLGLALATGGASLPYTMGGRTVMGGNITGYGDPYTNSQALNGYYGVNP